MIRRSIKINKNNSLFLFGPRGTGKTTLLRQHFGGDSVLWIDLLKEEEEERYRKSPQELSEQLATGRYEWVVIDEVQKLPRLLDRIHLEIEKGTAKFALTGSSARKLKRGSANLLAGRAFTNFLHPITSEELGEGFDLSQVLDTGSLPKTLALKTQEDIREYLNSYVSTYLTEEVVSEQIIRRIHPFKDFLKIAAQMNGEVLNYSKIARDIGVDDKTVRSYFSVLEDTLLGFYLRPYHRSIRKRQRQAPKFYLFDTGVKRALERTLRVPLEPGTYEYGRAFEHRVILECMWLNSYRKLDFEFSYLLTKDNAEIDLIIERPGQADLLVEIKSTTQVMPRHAQTLQALMPSWKSKAEGRIWSLDRSEKVIDGCKCFFWKEGLKESGLFI